MGTNFYWKVSEILLPTGVLTPIDEDHPAIHLGKKSGVFMWSQEPEQVAAVLRQRPDEVLIEDEYGHQYTAKQFLEMLDSCSGQTTDSIGEWFC